MNLNWRVYSILLDPPLDNQFMETLHHMIEHNNLRISLLEQRNNKFRDILLHQGIGALTIANVDGHADYRNYRPLSAKCVVFNLEAVKISRPPTAESTRTFTPETYIIGHPTNSRPVSAASVRLLRPTKKDLPVDQLIQKPFIYSTVNKKQVTIQEGYSPNYPPSRFPFLNSSDPLAKYDGTLLERASIDKRPGSSLLMSRPPSSRLFKWDLQ
jgi:hypothetical protein